MKAIFRLLNPDNTMSVNRQLAHAIGLSEAVVYSALLSKYAYYEQREMLTDEKWFYSTAEDLEESTALTVRQQKRCIDKLVSTGLIFCKVQGMPARRYFCINDDAELLSSILDGGESSFDKTAKLDNSQIDAEISHARKEKPDMQIEQSAPVSTKPQNLFYPNVETRETLNK